MARGGRFGPILGRARRYNGRLVQLIVEHDPDSRHFGVIVGRKLLPTAVARNRARRLLRELYRRRRSGLREATVIFRIRQAPAHVRMQDLVSEADLLLDRAMVGEVSR